MDLILFYVLDLLPFGKAWKRKLYRNVYLKTKHWYNFRTKLIRERGLICQQCGRGVLSRWYLDGHHLTYRRLGHERTSDVVLLCRKCHKKRHAGHHKQY